MSRREQREQIFKILFGVEFHSAEEAQNSLQKVITKEGLIGRSYHWDRDPVSGLWLGNKKGIDDYCSMRRGGMSHGGAGYPGSARAGAL